MLTRFIHRRAVRCASRCFSASRPWSPPDEDSEAPKDYDPSKPNSFVRVFFPEFLAEEPDLWRFRKDMCEMPLSIVKFSAESQEYEISHIEGKEYFLPRRSIFVGLLGAFLPYERKFILSWARAARAIKESWLMDDIIAVSTNDAHVLKKYAEKLGYEERVDFLADPSGLLSQFFEALTELEDIGLRTEKFLGVMTYNRLKAVYQSVGQHLFSTTCVSPQFLWKILSERRTRMRLLL